MKNVSLLFLLALFASLYGCSYFYDNDSDAAPLIEVSDLQGCFYYSNEHSDYSYVHQRADQYSDEVSIRADYIRYSCSIICFSADSVTQIEDVFIQWNVDDARYQGDDGRLWLHVNADRNDGHSLVASYKVQIVEPTKDGFLDHNLVLKRFDLHSTSTSYVSHVSDFKYDFESEKMHATLNGSKINGIYSREKEGVCAQY